MRELEEPDQEIEIEQRKSTNFVEVGRTLFSRYPRRSALGFALLGTQAFIYNAVLFTFSIVLVDFFSVGEAVAGVYLVPFALANFLGALLLGRFFDTIGRRAMIAGTYLISAVGFAVLTVLFAQEQLGLTGFLAVALRVVLLRLGCGVGRLPDGQRDLPAGDAGHVDRPVLRHLDGHRRGGRARCCSAAC